MLGNLKTDNCGRTCRTVIFSLCLNQELSEVNHNLQEELRKVLTDLSDITRLNQQLSIENDNLRNRGGWMLREQQEKLEREIADVQDQNSRLNRLVNMSNVTAYEKMRRERDDALNQVAEERQKTFMAKKNFREDITKVNKKTKNLNFVIIQCTKNENILQVFLYNEPGRK